VVKHLETLNDKFNTFEKLIDDNKLRNTKILDCNTKGSNLTDKEIILDYPRLKIENNCLRNKK